MNGKREKTNAHGAGRILSYEPLKVHCDACDQDFNSWESFGRHVDEIVDKPADTRREAGEMNDEPMGQDWRIRHDRLLAASPIVLDAAENRGGDGSDMTCAPSNPTAGTTGNMSE